jgi:hypothetical protein
MYTYAYSESRLVEKNKKSEGRESGIKCVY